MRRRSQIYFFFLIKEASFGTTVPHLTVKKEERINYLLPNPASRANTIALEREATCNFPKIRVL